MTSDLSPSFAPATLATLAAAAHRQASTQRPDGKTVTTALLEAEKTAKQQRLTYPPEALYGTWRLCFTAPKKPHYQSGRPIGKGFYVPKVAIAHISFFPSESLSAPLGIRNQLRIGALQITFSGPAKYLGKKNLLAFDFNQLEVTLLGATLYRGSIRSASSKLTDFSSAPIGKLPFFAFFLANSEYVAARGRGGGLALWGRVNQD
ncbi:MAG TPA: hypothetical protein V6D07_07025 [Trichocoleus sp.]